MNTELFIARKIHFIKNATNKNRISKPAVRIATIGIAIGIAVMIISVGIVTGFKQAIQNKLVGFGSHIQISNFSNNSSFETPAISFNSTLINELTKLHGVYHAERFCTKPAIIKTNDNFQGIVLKGIDKGYDWRFFQKHLTEGRIPHITDSTKSNEVLMSKETAQLLKLHLNDSFITYFIQNNIRLRKFKIVGIFSTGLYDFDRLFILGDLQHIQTLNGWNNEEVSGVELLVDDYNHIPQVSQAVFELTANRFDNKGNTYYTRTIQQLQPNLFSWLNLLDINVLVIIILMLSVAGFNMISGLLILILERTNMIGILKALGSSNWSIRKIFLYQSVFLIGKGLLWGNVIGIGLCLLQQHFSIITLDPNIYYVSTVPIELNLLRIVSLNIIGGTVSLLMLLIPSYIIAKIRPANSIRFE